jgi:hypothetical protein
VSDARYRVTINGFRCHNETWDALFNEDGKNDEVFIGVNTKVVAPNGTVKRNLDSQSETMGDTLRQPGRVQAGSASNLGGIRTNDSFPATPTPWLRTLPLDGHRYPPYVIWEGELADGGDIVMLTPTIWEYDPAESFVEDWINWHVQIDDKFGQRAKDIYSKIWPISAPVFDAVSLGIQTLGKAPGLWGPLGHPMSRPIGIQRNPDDPNGFLFNPQIIALTRESAEYLVNQNDQGLGTGITELLYVDDPHLKGRYSIYLQIEKLTAANAEWTDIGHAGGVVAMTASDGRLFCATTANDLWMRESVHHDVDWQRIGHANGVVGLAAIGDRLFCATNDNRLWTRDTQPREIDWTPIGHANGVVGMTALDGQLYCATNDNGLHVRPPVLADTSWTRIGHANGVLALAAAPGSLYCATSAGLNRRDPVLTDANWQQIGTAPGVRGLAATGGELFAATSADRLLVRRLP